MVENELNKLYDKEKIKYVNEKVQAIANDMERQVTKLTWETENKITDRKGTNNNRLMGKNPEDRIKKSIKSIVSKKKKDHFYRLLEQPLMILASPLFTKLFQ